jgi:hypothetical protein
MIGMGIKGRGNKLSRPVSKYCSSVYVEDLKNVTRNLKATDLRAKVAILNLPYTNWEY